jgi:anti-sigma B factor antagonist
MFKTNVSVEVRKVNPAASVIDIRGLVTAAAEDLFLAAFEQASEGGISNIIMNFEEMEYMNSSGIGLLVTFLIRARRSGKRLMVVGLNEHYRNLFDLTRLNEAVEIFDTEAEALAAALAPPAEPA